MHDLIDIALYSPPSSSLQTWAPDGYHLWMLPVDARAKLASETSADSRGQMTPLYKLGVRGHHYGNQEQVLVMRFLKNSVVANPIIVS